VPEYFKNDSASQCKFDPRSSKTPEPMVTESDTGDDDGDTYHCAKLLSDQASYFLTF